jgi:hypothetical protein
MIKHVLNVNSAQDSMVSGFNDPDMMLSLEKESVENNESDGHHKRGVNVKSDNEGQQPGYRTYLVHPLRGDTKARTGQETKSEVADLKTTSGASYFD